MNTAISFLRALPPSETSKTVSTTRTPSDLINFEKGVQVLFRQVTFRFVDTPALCTEYQEPHQRVPIAYFVDVAARGVEYLSLVKRFTVVLGFEGCVC